MSLYLRTALLLLLCALQTAALGAMSSRQDRLARVMDLYGLSTLIDHIPRMYSMTSVRGNT